MNTAVSGEAGLEILVGKLTKIWRRLEALLAKWKRAMAEGFDDPYDDGPRPPNPFRNHDLAELVRLAGKLGMHYQEGNRNDDGGIKKVVIGVGITLAASFIIGGWLLSNQVSSLTATVTARFNEQDRRFAEQNDRISRLEIKSERIKRDEQP